jgi:hypothetical protein
VIEVFYDAETTIKIINIEIMLRAFEKRGETLSGTRRTLPGNHPRQTTRQ